MRGQAVALASVAALALAGCLHADDVPEPTRRARLTLTREGPVSAWWVAGTALYTSAARRRPITLGGAVNSTLFAGLAPAAVPDRAGRLLLYSSWRGRAPVLRVYDLRRRRDRVLATGAFSAAWRRDRALAHFAALRPELRMPQTYVGHVVVRRGLGRPAERWTAHPGRYVASAWAGDRLLAYRLGRGWPELLAVDSPGRVRVLAADSALVAVSPDGKSAFVARYGARRPLVRLLDVATGRELARLNPGRGIEWITESGSWAGDRVFAASSAGLAVFRVGSDRIELADVLARPGEFPLALAEPQADESGRRVAAHGELASQPRQAIPSAAVVDCVVATRRCAIGPRVASVPGPRLVYNPSRP